MVYNNNWTTLFVSLHKYYIGDNMTNMKLNFGKEESNNMNNTAKIYIFLTRTNTVLSNIIHFLTKSEYTHAGLSLDNNLDWLYSFSRVHKNNPFIGGFMHENVTDGVYAAKVDIPCAIYELEIDLLTYDKVKKRINSMFGERHKYHYNIKGLIYYYFNKKKDRPYHYFCSEFVAEILIECGATKHKMIPSLTKPKDLTNIPDLKLIFWGNIKEYKNSFIFDETSVLN